jgi:hypothetical protein
MAERREGKLLCDTSPHQLASISTILRHFPTNQRRQYFRYGTCMRRIVDVQRQSVQTRGRPRRVRRPIPCMQQAHFELQRRRRHNRQVPL